MKTLSDSQAAYVDLIPLAATIENLISLDPALWSTRAPRSTAEFVTVQVVADVVAFKLKEDRDFHIVLRGSSSETMIAEIPAPSCVRGSRVEAEMRSARAAFLRLLGRPQKSLTVLETPVSAGVTGVLFLLRATLGETAEGGARGARSGPCPGRDSNRIEAIKNLAAALGRRSKRRNY